MNIEALQRVHDRALAIRAKAEDEGRDYTPEEAAELDRLFSMFDLGADLLDQQPGRRQSAPNAMIGGATPGETSDARLTDAGGGEYYALTDGTKVRAYRPHEPLAAQRDHKPFNLARVAAAAWSGNWTLCQPELQVMAQQHGMTGASGGFLIPEFVSREIIDLARAQSRAIAAGVRTMQMPEPVVKFAKVLNDPTVTWRPELYPIPQSAITFGEFTMEAKTAGAILLASEELLQDAPNADGLFRRLLASALAAEMDRVIFAGSGSGSEPEGILFNSSVPVMIVGGKLTYDVATDAVVSLQLANSNPDTLVLHPAIAGSLAKQKDTTGNPLQAPVVWTDLRKLVSNRLPAGGGSPSNWPAILGGFEEVVLGVRLPITLAVANAGGEEHDWGDGSPQLSGDAFQRYALRFRAVMRMDVGVLRPQLLTNIVALQP